MPLDASTLVRSPTASDNLIDPFFAFPVSGATKNTMRKFHGFFSQQGGFLTDHNRKLAFDQGYFPALYAAAMDNAALCMSVVAMATSYNAVHHNNRVTPDIDTLMVYSQTFDTIRLQIQKEETVKVTESTVLAVLQMLMGSGIGFGDADASLTHWNGVLALLDKYPYFRLSGRVMFFVTQIEYWLSISFDLKPKGEDWPEALPNSILPPPKYGHDIQQILDLPGLWNESSSKLLSVALNMCRATEVLEAAASSASSKGSSPPYFMHLFDVLLRQQARLNIILLNRKDIVECVCITLNIYFMLVIKSTPWRAPIERSCVRLQESLEICELDFGLGVATPTSRNTFSTANEEENKMLSDLYLWMLVICASALQLCQKQLCLAWALDHLRVVCQGDLDLTCESGKAEVLRHLRRICWSDLFLGRRFEEVCVHFNRRVEDVTGLTESSEKD